jgi:sirohydrochlorin cobaltochelatase
MLRGVNYLKVLVVLVVAGALLAAAGACLASGGHGEKKPMKKALLLVTFGTSVPEAQGVFAGIDAAYKKAFPGLEIRWAYTAKMIRNKVAKEQGKTWLSPEEALAKLMAEDYTHVGVQSLHVLAGAEYHDLVAKVHGFKVMSPNFKALMGYPLCATTDDLKAVVEALMADLPKERKAGEAIVYMGHGTHHPGGVVYPALAYMLQLKDPNVYMGTVEGYPELGDVQEELKAKKIKKAYLLPFMTVAGDHAMNDMAGEEDDSWKSVLTKDGIACVPVMRAITQNQKIVDIYIKHSKAMMAHFK